jgi:N-acetylneuraminic acid mutarotase
LWEYDTDSGQWTQKTSLGGGKRRDAAAFAIDGKGYVCTGVDNGDYEDDFWEYDPSTDSWSRKRSITDNSDDSYDDDYDSIIGINKATFIINGKGYLATAGKGTTSTTVWEYDPTTDLWIQKTSLEATARLEAVGFGIGDLGYIVTGRNGSYYFDDLWGFLPDMEQEDDDSYDAIVN